MLNYEVDPDVLAPFVPAGTELDLWDGKALVSMVGFRFTKTRLLGLPIPFHTNFDEVNLRFYVRRASAAQTAEQDPQRGVVFVKEIVPMPWIARIARWVYGEKYIALPMNHTIEERGKQLCPDGLVEYAWRYQGRLNRLGGLGMCSPSRSNPVQRKRLSPSIIGAIPGGVQKRQGSTRWLTRSGMSGRWPSRICCVM